VFELGNDVTALESVPTALFAFLRGCRRFPGPRQFQQTIRWELGICFMYWSVPTGRKAVLRIRIRDPVPF
jgi:hypothetical protein